MTELLLYMLALSLVLLAPVLGLLAAAVAFWHALLAGSVWYMPLGLVLVLAAIALVQSHKRFDLALLGLLVVAVIAWFGSGPLQQGRLLEAVQAMAAQTSLMAGLLLTMLLALAFLYTTRLVGKPTWRSRLIWISLPVVVILSVSAFGGSVAAGSPGSL